MTTQETAPARDAPAPTATAAADASSGVESERKAKPAAAATSASGVAPAFSSSSSSPSSSSSSPRPFSPPLLVPVAHSSRGGGIVEAPPGWGQALATVSSKQQQQQQRRKKGAPDPLDDPSSPQSRVAADFLWHKPLPEAAAADDERRRWRLARSGGACVLRAAPLAARLVASPSSSSSSSLSSSSTSSSSLSPRLLSLEEIAEMGGRETESDDDDDDDEEEEDSEGEDREERAPRRRPGPRPKSPPIPATLLAAGPRAPPELYALDERKNQPGAHYRVRFPPTTKHSRRLEGSESEGGGRRRRRSSSALASLAAAAAAWEGRPSLLTARLMTGGAEPSASASSGIREEERSGEEALRKLVREGVDWGWLASLCAGNDGDDGGGNDDAESPPPSPPSPSSSCCWSMPSAVDCEWAGGGGGGGRPSSAGRVVVLPASYAAHDRVFAQVRGRRRVLVASPLDALEKCYPLSAAHPCDGASAVLWRDPDLGRWPRFASLRCQWSELGPGDVLRVPAYWMLHSELLLPEPSSSSSSSTEEKREGAREGCVTLVLRSPAARRGRCRGSLLLQAARQAELELLRAFPAARAAEAMRDLLRIVKSAGKRGGGGGSGEESGGGGGIFLSFAAAADTSAANEALAAALTDLRAACLGSARALLRALEAAADRRRLCRTPWLEADGGRRRLFPPALAWTTAAAARAEREKAAAGGGGEGRRLLFVDSRTAEERKYPSLFRATIEAKARERVPWVPKKKQLLLEQKQRKEEEEEKGEAAESLLLLEPAK